MFISHGQFKKKNYSWIELQLVYFVIANKNEEKHFEYLIGTEVHGFRFREGFAVKHRCNPAFL